MTAIEYTALAARYKKQKKAIDIFSYLFIALAAVGLIGIIVCVIMLGVSNYDKLFLTILVCVFLGSALLFGIAAFGAIRYSAAVQKKELDARELADGEQSFFVGEGTLATFEGRVLRIHGFVSGAKKEKNIFVPYEEVRFFSVCSRRSPKDKGEWSVVFEIPVKYLTKNGKAQKDEPPALIQTSGKERIYTCIKEHGLKILGELPQEGEKATCEKKRSFILPDKEKRKRILMLMVAGGVLLAGGIVALFLWNTTIGAIITVLGGYLFFHSLVNFSRAKSVVVCYDEGIFKKQPSSPENLYLKWEEILSFRQNGDTLRLECLYGEFELPAIEGLFAYLTEEFPDKCKN